MIQVQDQPLCLTSPFSKRTRPFSKVCVTHRTHPPHTLQHPLQLCSWWTAPQRSCLPISRGNRHQRQTMDLVNNCRRLAPACHIWHAYDKCNGWGYLLKACLGQVILNVPCILLAKILTPLHLQCEEVQSNIRHSDFNSWTSQTTFRAKWDTQNPSAILFMQNLSITWICN